MMAGMNRFLALAPIALLLTGCATTDMWSEAPGSYRTAPSAPVPWWGNDAPSVSLFYGPLSAYGMWVEYPAYGRVFIPNGIGPGWKPYSQGYWSNDRYGRRWMSQEPFGWATYHYGRWGFDPNMGWFWVPDTHFSPAWVDWRYADGYSSWAPMAPIGWGNYGYYGDNWWMTAPDYYLWRPGLHQYIRPGLPGNYYPGHRPRPPVTGRPDYPNCPNYPNRPNWPDGGGVNRPDRPMPGNIRPGSQKDAPASNIGAPPREDVVEGSMAAGGGNGWVPQPGARPTGSRPDSVRPAPPWMGQPRRNPAMAPPPAYTPPAPRPEMMRPAPAPRPEMRPAPAPRPEMSAPEPHVSQPRAPRSREPAPRTQDD